MFFRLITDSFARQPRRKLLTTIALALGTAIATATLTVALDVGDRLAREFRSLGANLLVTPEADTLPLEIGGVDYRPVDSGVFLSEAELGKLKTIFWRNNVIGFAPFLDVPIAVNSATSSVSNGGLRTTLIGTWDRHNVRSRMAEAFSARAWPPPIRDGRWQDAGFPMIPPKPWWARISRGAQALGPARHSRFGPAAPVRSYWLPESFQPAGRRTMRFLRRSKSRRGSPASPESTGGFW